MKKILLLTLALVSLGIISHEAAAACPYSVGQKTEVKWKGKWYPATVKNTKVESGNCRYKIHYNGWNNSWDEWVGVARIRGVAVSGGNKQCPYLAGSKIDVRWKNKYYPSRVMKIKRSDGACRYKIHYIGWGAQWDEWVGLKRIRR